MNTRQTQTVANSGIIGIWLGIAVGAVVAGVVTMLFNPRSGRGNRELIVERAAQAKEAIIWHARAEAQAVEQKDIKKKK